MKVLADENIPFVKEALSTVADCATAAGRAISAKDIKDADALLVRSITKVDEKLLAGTSVKFVATATIGFEHIDIDYLEKAGIGFATAAGSNANSVAEYVVSAILNLAYKYNFDPSQKSIGIVGVGNVGSRVEKKAKALGMKVVLNDPPLQRQTNDEKYRPIEEIYDCDIVTMHTPLTYDGVDKTFHLAGEKFFSNLKNNAIFINSSRGKVHDTVALKNALKNGKLGGCVLDVWENEPDIDTELLDMVDFGTPHIAGYSYDGKIAGMIMVYRAFCEYFGIEPTKQAADFLPKPAIEKIIIEKPQKNPLRFAVNVLYDIGNDDANLRQIKEQPKPERAAFFDNLRKKYNIRREFSNTAVRCQGEGLKSVFDGLGFKIK